MPKTKKTYLTREEQEKSENLPTQEVDVPGERFQDKQQTPDVLDANKTSTNNPGFAKKKTESKGSVLKQEVAAHVVDTGLGGDIPTSATQNRGLSYGGNEGAILGSASYTPSAGQSRSDSRSGKKLDAVAKHLNFVPSEQVEESYDESKALAESPDKVQGYNGSPRNTNARTQKNNGFVPGELLFQRSVDEIKRDQLYYSTGQVVKRTGVDYADTPNIVPVLNQTTGVYEYPADNNPNYSLNRGNYLHRTLRVKFDALGRVTKFKFDTMPINCTVTDDTIMNDASANEIIDMNYAEMDRQKMDHKAGDEKADIWTPLARAVKQPTRTVGYLRDIENITGSEVFLAYKKTAACMSYQLNRAAKDGMNTIRPMVEACIGLTKAEQSSAQYDGLGVSDIFSADSYKKGRASLFIAINDSDKKYQNKADILLQPKSFKLALQTADNNMNPLRVKDLFVKAVNSREVFSTIDREYDPTMPVCISDRASIIHCYDFNDLYSFESIDSEGRPVFAQGKAPFSYVYKDLRNSYAVSATIPLLRGIHKYLNSVGSKIYSLVGSDEITIPMVHSTCYFSLWSLIVLSATPFIALERVNSLRDVLYYEKNVEYPFHQLITIKDANPMNAVNYKNPDYQLPLVVGRMQPSAAITWVLPELFWPFDEEASDDAYLYVLPWYFNQNEYTYGTSSVERDAGKYSMSYPSTRYGSRFGYLDDIYGMDERDIRLSLDRLVDIPVHTDDTGKQGVYKYSQNNDGIPFVRIKGDDFTPMTYLSLPRELGWFIVAPAGVLSQVMTKTAVTGTIHDDTFISNGQQLFGQSSYIIKYWHGKRKTAITGILEPISINVDRSSAYTQDWNAFAATQYFEDAYADWGMLFSLNQCFDTNGSLVVNKGKFTPFTNGKLTNGAETVLSGSEYAIGSVQKALWTRIQKLPFAISPFDMILYRNVGEDALKFDPFDFLYAFGLVGFKGSDYDEDVYNRSMDVINKGFTFLEDPFVKDSPLFKEAGLSTQSDNEHDLLH